jgi:hypothetical protein
MFVFSVFICSGLLIQIFYNDWECFADLFSLNNIYLMKFQYTIIYLNNVSPTLSLIIHSR